MVRVDFVNVLSKQLFAVRYGLHLVDVLSKLLLSFLAGWNVTKRQLAAPPRGRGAKGETA